jgi:hypothetical protein
MSMDPRLAAVLSNIKTPLRSEKDELLLGEITAMENKESQAGRPQTVVTIAPVVNDVPVKDMALKLYVQRPIEGDDPATIGKLRTKGGAFLRACDEKFPKPPRKVSKGVYETEDGATISGTDVDRAFAADRLAVFEGLQRLEDDEAYCNSFISQRVFFAPQKAKVAEPGAQYSGISQFIGYVTNSIRDDQTLNTDDVVDHEVLDEAVAVALAAMEE